MWVAVKIMVLLGSLLKYGTFKVPQKGSYFDNHPCRECCEVHLRQDWCLSASFPSPNIHYKSMTSSWAPKP